MKKNFLKRACAASLLFAGVFSSHAMAGTDDGSIISDAGVEKPHFRTSVYVREGYDDNAETSNNNQVTSGYTSFGINEFADFGSDRSILTIGVQLGANYYYSQPGQKFDWTDNLSLNYTYKLNERLTLSLASYAAYQVEPQYDLLVAQNRVNGQYFYFTDVLSASYQWTRRFSTITNYTLDGIFYQDAAPKVTNDYVAQTFGNQFRFLALPTTTLVAEYRFGIVNYLYQSGNNSITNYFLTGFDHTFNPKLLTTLRVGAEIQDQNVGGISTSPYAEWSVNYAYQHLSSLGYYLRYGFDYSNLTVAQTDKALRTGININHGFSPKLTATLGIFYQHDDYSNSGGTPGTAFTENTIDIQTGLQYAMTPRLSLNASYTYTDLLSNNSLLEYHRSTVSIGANYGF